MPVGSMSGGGRPASAPRASFTARPAIEELTARLASLQASLDAQARYRRLLLSMQAVSVPTFIMEIEGLRARIRFCLAHKTVSHKPLYTQAAVCVHTSRCLRTHIPCHEEQRQHTIRLRGDWSLVKSEFWNLKSEI